MQRRSYNVELAYKTHRWRDRKFRAFDMFAHVVDLITCDSFDRCAAVQLAADFSSRPQLDERTTRAA